MFKISSEKISSLGSYLIKAGKNQQDLRPQIRKVLAFLRNIDEPFDRGLKIEDEAIKPVLDRTFPRKYHVAGRKTFKDGKVRRYKYFVGPGDNTLYFTIEVVEELDQDDTWRVFVRSDGNQVETGGRTISQQNIPKAIRKNIEDFDKKWDGPDVTSSIGKA